LHGINAFSVRFHDALKKGKHLDYILGNKKNPVCVDFIIPGKIVDDDPRKEPPYFPGTKKMLLVFQSIHPIEFLTAEMGEKHVIPSGEYGAGTWTTIVNGNASIVKDKSGYTLKLEGKQFKTRTYKIVHYSGKDKKNYLIWKMET